MTLLYAKFPSFGNGFRPYLLLFKAICKHLELLQNLWVKYSVRPLVKVT